MKNKIENLWQKTIITVLAIFGPMVIIGYLYYTSNSCGINPWDCLGFDALMLGGGMIIIFLPVAIILLGWEIYKKTRREKINKM